jgi:hypothetical protein
MPIRMWCEDAETGVIARGGDRGFDFISDANRVWSMEPSPRLIPFVGRRVYIRYRRTAHDEVALIRIYDIERMAMRAERSIAVAVS